MKGVKKFSKVQELVYELKVCDVMRREVITVDPDTPMSRFREVLKERNISGTPVVKEERLVGIVSIEDLIRWLTECREDFPIKNRMSTHGMGLNNIQSCADEMNISSVVNEGTRLVVRIYMKKDEAPRSN